MYTSKLKLTLHWLLITVAFYILWALAYLILVKFAATEIDRLSYDSKNIGSNISAADIFWWFMFVFGIAVVLYGIKTAVQYSPNPKIAALIYGLLIIFSAGTLIIKLLETVRFVDTIPHIIINCIFLAPLVAVAIKEDDLYEKYNKVDPDSSY